MRDVCPQHLGVAACVLVRSQHSPACPVRPVEEICVDCESIKVPGSRLDNDLQNEKTQRKTNWKVLFTLLQNHVDPCWAAKHWKLNVCTFSELQALTCFEVSLEKMEPEFLLLYFLLGLQPLPRKTMDVLINTSAFAAHVAA